MSSSTELNIAAIAKAVIDNVSQAVIGKRESITLILSALFSEGHVLIEDVPGVGKTAMAKTLARSFNSSYSRIQCTPDLLPSDILGVNIYNPKTGEFSFRKGPIDNNIVLTDEINRANPKTQSALLESMEEYQVTSDGVSVKLPRPFMIIATQNPIEYEGVFSLPEAQLDRFFIRCNIGYPDLDSEADMLLGEGIIAITENLKPVSSLEELSEIQSAVNKIKMERSVLDYLLKIVRTTREHNSISMGASPRGSIALCRASKAYAAISGRDFVTPDDVKYMAVPVLAHRIKPRTSGQNFHRGEAEILEILSQVKPPK